ncbi:DUF547 domain-containing protein [Mesohalobacter halotolerans]|uniref:DUF547 domain-containing protein n=1 Tax=Mesohalobacter halotolerans TaxID=1883405 RepID=A0A4U5TSY7_9FLAO|nr:DUF547 domain-containing protein [Mesohalobacter halotolerans]TKS57459.1 DUF547 domain-containing protein [Mesohalobacter halotolerans]
MKISLYSLATIFSMGILYNIIAQNTPQTFSFDNNNLKKNYQVNYSNWSTLLQKHVDEKGFVDYKSFVNDKDKLLKFTHHLENNIPQKHWSDNQKKAYLINAYNAYTIQLVIEHYPVKSIKDIGGVFSNVFKKDFINFNGEMIALDDIEKGMLFPMGDPRIHFAVNCASFSCPKLNNAPYYPENLDQQLNQAARDFINSKRNMLSPNKAKLSKIFKWYKSDFEQENQTLIDFINLYSETTLQDDISIEYLDYNWELNAIENANKS